MQKLMTKFIKILRWNTETQNYFGRGRGVSKPHRCQKQNNKHGLTVKMNKNGSRLEAVIISKMNCHYKMNIFLCNPQHMIN